MRLRHIAITLVLALCASTALALDATDNAASHPLPVGSDMPDLLLSHELDAAQLGHLGLNGASPCRLSDIEARTVIMVAFSMYCPHCQREAPTLNELGALIADRGLAKDVKLIGVGIGNSNFEVKVFRTKYAITFPLFSDPDFRINKEIGEVGTPFFYVLVRNPETKGFKVADSYLGRLESAGSFLDRAMQAAGGGK